MHSSSQIPELYLYVCRGYFNTFFTRIHKLLWDKVHYSFSLAYSIDPNMDTALPPKPHVITYEEVDLDEEEPLHQWYSTKTNEINPPSIQYSDKTPDPSKKVTWSNNTKPLVTDPSQKSVEFQLGMYLMYRNV